MHHIIPFKVGLEDMLKCMDQVREEGKRRRCRCRKGSTCCCFVGRWW